MLKLLKTFIFLIILISYAKADSSIKNISYKDNVVTVFSGSVVVPSNILGIDANNWPGSSGTISPAPTYNYQIFRIWDYSPGVRWRMLQNGSNDFSGGGVSTNWGYLDTVIDTEYAAGKQILYTIGDTPLWCSSNPTLPDPYGTLGGTAPPTDNIYLNQFITQLITRYNTDIIRNNGGAHKIKFLGTWNEPGLTDANANCFFCGTNAQLAAVSKVIYQAAHAVDNSIIVLSPEFPFFDIPTYILPYLETSDGGSGHASDWFDGIAYHPYGTNIPNFVPNLIASPSTIYTQLYNAMLTAGMTPVPIYATEQAITPSNTPSQPNFYILPLMNDLIKSEYVFQTSVLEMIAGFQTIIWYAHDDVFFGNPSVSSLVSKALNSAASLAGKTITKVQTINGQTMVVTCSDGTVVSF